MRREVFETNSESGVSSLTSDGRNLMTQKPSTPRDKKKTRRFVAGKHTSVSKNDIRRKYAQMYIDALNSGNVPIFKKNLKDFAISDIVLVTRNISPSGMFLPSYVEVCLLFVKR